MNYYFYDKNKDFGEIVEVSFSKNELFGTYWSRIADYDYLASCIYEDIETNNFILENDSGIQDSFSRQLIDEGIDVETNEGILKYCDAYVSESDWFKNSDDFEQYIKFGQQQSNFGGPTSKTITETDIFDKFKTLDYIGEFDSIAECREHIKSMSLFTTS